MPTYTGAGRIATLTCHPCFHIECICFYTEDCVIILTESERSFSPTPLCYTVCWPVYVNLTQANPLKGGRLIWENASIRSVWMAFSYLVIHWGGSPHCGGAIPGLVVLYSVRKQDEQAMRNNPVSSSCLNVSALSSCPGFSEWWFYKQFPPQVTFGVFIAVIKTLIIRLYGNVYGYYRHHGW